MIGIYKITSPNGHVYIGQSIDIQRRFSNYRCINEKHNKTAINRSILKHGYMAHTFEIIHALPYDVSKEILVNYEQLYMDLYSRCGITLLNMCPSAGSPAGFKRPPEQVERHRAMMRGRPSPMRGMTHTEAAKEKIKAKRALQVMPKGYKRSLPPWNKGVKGVCLWGKGRKLSDETKEKIRLANLGKKLSAETIAKRTATLKKNGVKRKWTDEARRRQSERYRGKPGHMLGFKHTEETRKKISDAQKGKIISAETRKKMSETHKKKWSDKTPSDINSNIE